MTVFNICDEPTRHSSKWIKVVLLKMLIAINRIFIEREATEMLDTTNSVTTRENSRRTASDKTVVCLPHGLQVAGFIKSCAGAQQSGPAFGQRAI